MDSHGYKLIWQSGFYTTMIEVTGFRSPREALFAAAETLEEALRGL